VLEELKVAGPLTMMFFDPTRREMQRTRLIGSVEPSDLINSVTALKR
jgi:hypothetical protein